MLRNYCITNGHFGPLKHKQVVHVALWVKPERHCGLLSSPVIINNSDLIVYTFSLLPVRKLRRRPCEIFLLCRLQHHFLALPAKIMQKSERKKEVQPLATVFIYISPTFLMGVSPFFFCAAISACRGFKEGYKKKSAAR